MGEQLLERVVGQLRPFDPLHSLGRYALLRQFLEHVRRYPVNFRA